MMIVDDGCSTCLTGKYSSRLKEVKRKRKNIDDSQEEDSTVGDLPFPAIQDSSQKERT
jgi:hypothetical protein